MRSSAILRRVFMGTLLLVLVFLLVYVASSFYFYLYAMLLISICVGEYLWMMHKKGEGGYIVIVSVFSLLFPTYFYFEELWSYLSIEMIIMLVLLSLALRVTFSSETAEIRMKRLQHSLIPIFFIGFALSFQVNIRLYNGGGWEARNFLLYYYLTMLFGDSFAYAFGSAFGKHKLAPEMSPKKTVEGAAFGIVGNVVGGLVCYFVFLSELSLAATVLISLLIGVISQIGDLMESIFKRSAEVKDASNLLMGHGGALDRADSFLISSPVFYYLISTVPKLL